MRGAIERERIQAEIDEAYASLQHIQDLFKGQEMPLKVVKVTRTIRAQLEAAEALLER